MPGLYGSTSTYTVTASNIVTLYSTSATAVITATTYATNFNTLYNPQNIAAVPTSAQQLIKLFDNNGNVQFFLDPATNSSTIAASVFQFTTATSAQLGNWVFSGNTATNAVNQSLTINSAGQTWTFLPTGQTQTPAGVLPNYTGTASTVLITDGLGNTNWAPPVIFPGSVTAASLATTGIANTLTYLRGDFTWAPVQGGGGVPNQVYDFGTFLVPVNFTLDMGTFV